MEGVYLWCAVICGVIFSLQFIMLLIGMGAEGDVDLPTSDALDADLGDVEFSDGDAASWKDADVDFDARAHSITEADSWFVGIVTFRSVVAGLTVFGLAGLATVDQFPLPQSLLIAIASGCAVLVAIGWGFKQLYLLQSDGTVDIRSTVGCPGVVYLLIPANAQGVGKVTVSLSDRTVEYAARTAGAALPTGADVVVKRVVSGNVVEVELANQESHHSL